MDTNNLITNSEQNLFINYKPQFNNLYSVEMFYPNDTAPNEEEFTIAKYHATKISFGGDSLELNRNPVSKMFHVKESDSYVWSNELAITWRESEGWLIKKYHENWLNEFYDKEKGVFRSRGATSPVKNLYRTFKIYFPTNSEQMEKLETSTKTNGDFKIIGIRFDGVMPHQVGDLNVGWATKGEIITHQLKYYIHSWKWITSSMG